jgi:hypothetical protein
VDETTLRLFDFQFEMPPGLEPDALAFRVRDSQCKLEHGLPQRAG